MNRLLNISQWDKSNDSTSIEIELILMKILVIECIVSYKCNKILQIYIQNSSYFNQYSIFLIADWII